VNNTLNSTTLPTGAITCPDPNTWPTYPQGYCSFAGNFDFFNYAGIERYAFRLQ
jgi:hypothetical protein